MTNNKGRGMDVSSSDGVITNGSNIYVPENTMAVIFNDSGIEGVVSKPGRYEYHDGEVSVLSGDSIWKVVSQTIGERFDFGGKPANTRHIAYINLRELRKIKYGTHGPLLYHDKFYQTDLEVLSHGTFSIQIVNPIVFIQNYLPANTYYYDFSDEGYDLQIISELTQSLIYVINQLSAKYRVSDLIGHLNEVTKLVQQDEDYVGSWEERFGFVLTRLAIENIELTDSSRTLIEQYADKRMNVSAYDNVSQQSADIAYKQKIASGIENHGPGDGFGFVMAMNASQKEPLSAGKTQVPYEEQIKLIKKFKGLLDEGLISEYEFETKKREILGM